MLVRWLEAVVLAILLAMLLAACRSSVGTNSTPATVSSATPVTGSSTPSPSVTDGTGTQPAPILRTDAAKEIILSTTTSTQDSGLLDMLLPRFEGQTGYRVKPVAVGSGAAIALGERGEADVVLVHAPESERQFVASGAGIDRQLVMYNDFVFVGPPDDPADIRGTTDALTALKQIAAKSSPFISRGDNSGTQQLELQLWKEAGITPGSEGWYVESGTGMGQTLQIADQRQAYTLSDRGTYLAFKDRIILDILVEKDERLLNVYHVITVNPQRFPTVNAVGAQALIDFLLAPETQQLIGDFGRDRYNQPLFVPCAQNNCGLKDPKD